MKLKSEIAWRLGYELVRIRKGHGPRALVWQIIHASAPTVCFDVGANEGQWAGGVLSDDASRRIVSFEPLSDAHRILTEKARAYPNWVLAPRMAIGNEDTETIINISGFSQSSSLLPMTHVHSDAVPETAYVSTETVPVRRLDGVGGEFLRPGDRVYLKIDTQGFEREVLEGATGIMENVVALQVELSFRELYAGETLAAEMMAMIGGLGFQLFGFCNGLRDPKTKALLQADAFFIR